VGWDAMGRDGVGYGSMGPTLSQTLLRPTTTLTCVLDCQLLHMLFKQTKLTQMGLHVMWGDMSNVCFLETL
jgi:hypothetical protein